MEAERPTVLILARDILGAGLLGVLADGVGKAALFPWPGESAEAAVGRLRPALILVEGTHPGARADGLFTAAASAGSRVILFVPSAPWQDVAAIAERRGVELVHPGPGESLGEKIAQALARA